MFNDINLSKELTNDFKKTAQARQISETGIEFVVEVLTNGHWPDNQQASCNLSPELKDITIKFENFYKQKYPNRNLKWLLNHGSVELKPIFATSKPYTL